MSVAQPPSIELLQGSPDRGDPPRRPVRLGVFLVTFLVCAALGLAFTYLRPPVYQTSATVLTVKPKGVDQPSADADIEHVAIQRRLLLGDEVLERLAAAILREGHDLERFAGPGGLRTMLAVLPVPDTNLVELRAEGGEPELVQRAVDHWAEAYVALRAARIADITNRTTAELAGEQTQLGRRIADKRTELEAFRERHDIVSMEREENETLSRLRGLNTSLNKAREEATEARARLSAVRTALAQGRVVVPDEEKSRLAGLQSEAQALRERLSKLEERYTRRYMELDPNLRDLPEALAAIEAQIRRLTSVGQAQVSSDAEQAVLVAEETVRSLEAELAAHRAGVAEFTARFAEHQVLEEELERLETLFNDNQERLARIETSNREQFPPLEVVDHAPLPLEPVRPLYTRDAGIALGLSVLVALFLAWLVDYLTGRMRREPAVTGVRIYGGAAPEAPLLPRQGSDLLRVGGAAAPQFPAAWPRELEPGEVAALLDAAAPMTALHAALLLSGVTPEEIPSLAGRVDPDSDTLDIPGPGARSLALAGGVRRLAAAATDAEGAWTDEEMRAGLEIAAADAGLTDAAGVSPEALQHTYVVFLVRQGARLGELTRRVGPLPAGHLSRYARLSPPGANRPLEDIDLFYPILIA
jgi:polysaccharide biosynthesis transport protein